MNPSLVAALLQEYGAHTRDILFRYLPKEEPKKYLYDLIADYPKRGGRAMRPSLCIATAKALGASLEDAVYTAVSIELMHNAMLIHDDIEDESDLRRGLPALHQKEGMPLALNAGDMLALLSLYPLLENQKRLGPALALRLFEETARMARESAEGQALELGWRRDNPLDINESDYLKMVLKKTCWLATIHPCRTGALIAQGEKAPMEAWVRFGFLVGAAFQIQDDRLNLIGDTDSYGKEQNGDIYEGKRTLMLIHLLENATDEERHRLHRLLGLPRNERAAGEIAWVRDRMDYYDCLEYARLAAHALAGAAVYESKQILKNLPNSRDKQFLEALPYWVIDRA